MSGWWQCISSLPTMLWRFAAFGASAHSLWTTSIGGLCVRMVAVLQLTTANTALAIYLLRCFRLLLQQRQALVAYVSGWWQCFSSLLPTMLWRPTYFGASAYSFMRWWPMCQDGGNASAHYCQQCFGDLPTSVLPLTPSAKASVGGLCVRMVAVLQLTTANTALAIYLLRCFRLLLQQRQALVAYVSGWWQCFRSRLPTMLWRPTCFGAYTYSFSKGKR